MEPRLLVIPDDAWLTHLEKYGITKDSVRYWGKMYDIEAFAEESLHDYLMRMVEEHGDKAPVPIPKVLISSTMKKWADRFNPSQLAAPGGFYDGKGTIHIKASRLSDDKLLMHEYGHAIDFPLHDHPSGIVDGLVHAYRVGFDVRSFTKLLRLRREPAELVDKYTMWRLMLDAA